jgi:RHS repeat-associated protein
LGTVRYTVIDGEVIAEKRGGVRSLYVPDPLGSTVALLDSTQSQTDTFSFWPYGENNARTGSTATPFQFVGTAGYHRDSANRTYVRARTLDTARGRWLTEGPIGREGGDWNLYRYAHAQAATIIDPSGTKPLGSGSCRDWHPASQCWTNCNGTQWDLCLAKCGGIGNVDHCCASPSLGIHECQCISTPPISKPPAIPGGPPRRRRRPPVVLPGIPIPPRFSCSYNCPIPGPAIQLPFGGPIIGCVYFGCTLNRGLPGAACPPTKTIIDIPPLRVGCGAGTVLT